MDIINTPATALQTAEVAFNVRASAAFFITMGVGTIHSASFLAGWPNHSTQRL